MKSLYHFAHVFPSNKIQKAVDKSSSISYIVRWPLNQSQCIKLGKIIEDNMRAYILNSTQYLDIRPTNRDGQSERDHLFTCGEHKIYAELKSNINLDTEKKKATAKKIKTVSAEEGTVGYLVALRYWRTDQIPDKFMKNKNYQDLQLVGVKEYLEAFGLKPFSSTLEYTIWINQLARALIESGGKAQIGKEIEIKENEIRELRRLFNNL